MWMTYLMFEALLSLFVYEVVKNWRPNQPLGEEPREKDTVQRIKQP